MNTFKILKNKFVFFAAISATAFLLAGCRSIPIWSENSSEGKRQLDPPANFPRPLEVSSEIYPIKMEFGDIRAFSAVPMTEFESPYLLMLIDESEVTKPWQDEARRLASLGYLVVCLPSPGIEDMQQNEIAWGEMLFQTVGWLSRLHDTRNRKGAAIGYGDAAARALQLSLLEQKIGTVVAWQPPPVVGRTMLQDLDVHWMLINSPEEFRGEQFKDWSTLNGLEYDFVDFENTSLNFAQPGSPSYFSVEADRARAVQQRFLLEQIGSTLSPSMEEISKMQSDNLPKAEVLFEESTN